MTENAVWTEVSLLVTPDAADAVGALVRDFTGNGVAIEPRIETLGPDEGFVLDAAAPQRLRGYLHGLVTPRRRSDLRRALRRAGLAGSVAGRLGWRVLREEDWAQSWKQHYEVQRVGRVVVRPAWKDYRARGDEVIVTLDPGMAFGTGQHPTTRMCLEALQEHLRGGERVLDLGTGSGILALAALALGASTCIAVDIDAQAVAAARANLALNRGQGRVEVRLGSIEAVEESRPFDIVLANINAAAVIALAARISAVLRAGGVLVAGGIIADRLAPCLDAVGGAGLAVERVLTEGEWQTVVARRPR